MKPYPIPDRQICSECGLDWSLHPAKPRRRDCIALLLDEEYPHKKQPQPIGFIPFTMPTHWCRTHHNHVQSAGPWCSEGYSSNYPCSIRRVRRDGIPYATENLREGGYVETVPHLRHTVTQPEMSATFTRAGHVPRNKAAQTNRRGVDQKTWVGMPRVGYPATPQHRPHSRPHHTTQLRW